jgi:type II secretory pathway pseudopilin PulG
MVEMLIVVAIIAVLTGMGIASLKILNRRTGINSTRALVLALGNAAITYQQDSWTVLIDHDGNPATPARQYSGRMWDLNVGAAPDTTTGRDLMVGDGLIDGIPATTKDVTHDGPFHAAVVASGYRGFAAMTGTSLLSRNLNKQGQIIDAWKRPLRIAWAARIYGTAGFGIWSCGPDGIDATNDDITSWGAKK